MDNKRMKQLWATANEYGLDSEALHDLISSELGKMSIKGLSEREAIFIIDRIKGKQGRIPEAPGMITYKQLGLIRRLEKKLDWTDNPERLKAFIYKQCGCRHIEWLSAWQASGVIEAMKRMSKQREAEHEGQNSGYCTSAGADSQFCSHCRI